jgi:hypothetical protein
MDIEDDGEEMVWVEYYSAECEEDEDGKLIPEYGPVSASDLKEMEEYDLPVHRSLW